MDNQSVALHRTEAENSTTDSVDPIHQPGVQAIFYVVYTSIFVLGMFGNILTTYVVCRNKDMQTVTNFFITNLALSDILLCTLSVPFTPMYTFLGKWVFGRPMCHLVAFAQGISVYVSTLTLTSIAIDRFFVIMYPFRQRMKIQTCMLIILATWITSVLAVLPYGLFMSLETHSLEPEAYVCEEVWPTDTFRKIYGFITFTLQFIIPFLIIAVCYIKISIRLNDRSQSRPGVSNPRREAMDRCRKKRTNRMLISMVFIFGLCWLPFNCINLLNDFSQSTGEWMYYNISFFIVHTIAMSSTCYNPFLYAWLNENFRKEFKQVLPGFQMQSRLRNGPDTVQDSLLTTMSVLRRNSSIVRERRVEPPQTTTAAYHPEDERIEFIVADTSSLLRDSDKASPSPAGSGKRRASQPQPTPPIVIGHDHGNQV